MLMKNYTKLDDIIAHAHRVLDHIDPKVPCPSNINDDLWDQLDAIILQWMYATISPDLPLTILESHVTAMSVQNHLHNIFQDNKASRAVYFQSEFVRCRLENFSSVSSYCQHMKDLADKLANFDTKVSDHQMVIYLIVGLSKEFDIIVSLIQQSEPLPNFSKAHSMILLKETHHANQKTIICDAKVLPAASKPPPDNPNYKPISPPASNDGGDRGNGGLIILESCTKERIYIYKPINLIYYTNSTFNKILIFQHLLVQIQFYLKRFGTSYYYNTSFDLCLIFFIY